jgi:ParB family chromosome partitioning protein
MIVKVPLDNIRNNPYQPKSRINVPETEAEELAKSILINGLIYNPKARIKPDMLPENGFQIYEIADGWRRLAAFRWLVKQGKKEYAEITLDIEEYTDQQMADLIPEANDMHKQMTPIEKAEYYKQYINDFKITQTELAKRKNCKQGTIANAISLLDLPDNIQQKIISQEIKETLARELLRLNDPQTQTSVMNDCIANNWTVVELGKTIDDIVIKQSCSLEKSSQPTSVIEMLHPYFVTVDCSTCKSKFKIKKEDRCNNKSCWNDKQEKAIAEIKLITEKQAPLISAAEIKTESPKTPETEKPVIVPTPIGDTSQKDIESSPAKDLPLLSGEPEVKQEPISNPPAAAPKPQAQAPAVTKPAPVLSKWKRKLAMEETESGVRMSLMGGGFVIKNLIGNLESTVEQLPGILTEANKQWLEKETK